MGVLALGVTCWPGSAAAAGGSASGWGYNSYGQVGNGSPTKTGCQCLPTPTPVLGLSDVSQISLGYAHGLALHSNGTVTAWGYNAMGQLGNGTTSESATPVPVSGLSNVVAVDAGYEHNLALLANGTVMAWGDNYFGELGVGGSDFAGGGPESCGSATPLQQACRSRCRASSDVVAIDAGYRSSARAARQRHRHGLGLRLLRLPRRRDRHSIRVRHASNTRCRFPEFQARSSISTEHHGMALLANGTVTAWGQDTDGQIGNGTDFEAPPPECLCVAAVSVIGLSGPVRQIAAGGYHSVALLGSGIAQAWGYNGEGELGQRQCDNGRLHLHTGGRLTGARARGAQSVAAGDYHTLALLGDGSVRAWGYNTDGQLGDGTEEDRSAPVPGERGRRRQ